MEDLPPPLPPLSQDNKVQSVDGRRVERILSPHLQSLPLCGASLESAHLLGNPRGSPGPLVLSREREREREVGVLSVACRVVVPSPGKELSFGVGLLQLPCFGDSSSPLETSSVASLMP